MKRLIAITLLSASLALTACGSSESQSGASAISTTTEAQSKATDTAEYDGCTLQIESGEISDGVLTVKVKYTNSNSDPLYALESFAVKAYQNDVELDDATDINDEALGSNLIKEVMNGKSIEGEYKFNVPGDGEVTVNICTPTADEEVLASSVY